MCAELLHYPQTVWARLAQLAEPHITAQAQSDTGGTTNRLKQYFIRRQQNSDQAGRPS